MVAVIRRFADHLGLKRGRFTGHSLRTAGAQHLAKEGWSDAKITVFGRWASKHMLTYVREALIEPLGAMSGAGPVVQDSKPSSSGTGNSSGTAARKRAWQNLARAAKV